jgi:hypothetical protein
MSIFSFTIVNMSIETPDGVLDVTNATLRVPQIEVQGTSVTTSLSTLSNVGVGTTTPGGRLHVYGPDAKTLLQSTSNTANVEIGGPSGAIVDLKGPFTDDYDLRIQSSSDGGNLATTGNVNHIRLASTSGYTGFGTATPQYKIDAQGVKGIDAVSNPSAHNPVFLYDDQESTTTFSGTVGGTGASRNTTSKYIELNSLADNVTGYAYWPIQMPNSWSAEFDHFIGGGDGGESLSFSFFNTSAPTTTGNHGGYRLAIAEFYGGAPAAKAVLYYQGSEVAQKNIVGGIPSSSWNKVVVNYNRGSISLSLNGRSVFSYEATENADSYTGRYVGFIGKTGLRDNFHRVRNVKCTSGTNWVYATGSNATTLAYLSGNVGIGTDVTTERLEISGNVKATHFVGDGGLLSNIATTLNAIVNQGNTTSNTVQFTNADTGIVATGNIVVEEGGFFVGDGSKLVNIPTDFESIIVNGNTTSNVVYFANTDVAIQASGNVVVDSDSFFIGNGGLLSNIATTLEDISNQGNATSNTIQFTNSDVGFVTTANVGISNSAPTKNLSVGSNLHVDDTGSNVLTVHGNVAANAVTIGAFQVVASYGLNQVTAENNQTSDTLVLTNATKGIDASSNIDLGGQLNFGSNVKIVGGGSGTYLSTLRVANVASNIVTYDQATGEVFDSGGLISNKLAIVSEQPPSALTGATTVVDGHGRYKVTTSLEASSYKAYKVFDKTIGQNTNGWSTGAVGAYNNDGTYAGSNTLASVNGEWIKLELPYKTTLRHVALAPRDGISYSGMPEDFSIVASNDDSTWVVLKSVDGQSWSSTDYVNFVVDASTAYKYYAIVVELTNNNFAQIGEWKLFTETFSVDAGVVSTTAASGLDVGYTEHPVEPMTDYHTYVEGHGTYEASASSYDASFSLYPWEVFDHSLSTRWTISTSDDNYNASTGDWDQTAIDASPNVFTSDVGGTRYHGHWLQIKLPYAITLSHSNIYPQTTARAPVDGVILGSNDGEHWYKLTEFSGKTYSASTWTRIDVNATTSYQYFRMCATKNGGDSKVELNEWRLFAEKPVTRMENVHISGDLSSETLHTSYIKWPKVPLKANESEGYVVDASSADSGSTTKYSVFNDLFIGQGTEYWDSASTYSTSTGAHNNTVSTTDIDGVARYGEWIQIKLTNAIALHSMKWYPRIYYSSGGTYETWPLERVPKSGVIMGSNDGITWRTLRDFADISYTTAAYVEGTEVKVISSTPYVYYRLVITSLNAGTSSNRVGIMELQLFEAATGVGAAPTSAKLQVAGSLGMAKGSEFFAGDDVVMELPKHDRPLVKYPEVAMTANSSGGYVASVSSNYDINNYPPYEAFNGVYGTELDMWISSSYTYLSDGTADTSNCATFNGVYGEYLALSMPNKIKLEKMRVHSRNNATVPNAPHKGRVYGSNDNSNWTQIGTYDGLNMIHNDYRTIIVNATEYYKHYTFQVEQINPSFTIFGYVNIAELEYWGYEEGDTSVDVVHKSIPNKPGQQHLEVYWDANDINSYSFADSDAVYDLSGNGVTATISGAKGFNAKYNSWILNNNLVDYISSTLSHSTGAWAHSVSTWMYRYPTTSTNQQNVFQFGTTVTNEGCAARFEWISNRWMIRYYFMFNDVIFYLPGHAKLFENWIHITATYDGGSDSGVGNGSYGLARKLYINGVPCEVQSSTSPGSLNLATTSSTFYLGHRPSAGSLIGEVANARVYSKALSAEQVRELYEYDAPRFGHRQNLVALHKGNLGVGVAHPTSRFEVAGTETLQEYPPRAMTGFETYMEGHGTFRVSASSTWSTNEYEAFGAFNKTLLSGTPDLTWNSVAGGFSSGSDYAYTGTNSLGGISGEWLKLSTPYAIKPSAIKITVASGYINSYAPEDFYLLGSVDDATWYVFAQETGETWSSLSHTSSINTTNTYKYFALVVTKTRGSDTTNVAEMQVFGTPAPSSLEDGHLTLGKALTLPRVSGHPAGAETPRAESLVVHYDTTVDSVVSGSTVVDISGNGLNGTLNGAAYSSTDRAFTFDGVDDYVSGTLNNPSGAWVHSVSYWLKPDAATLDDSGNHFAFNIGAVSSTKMSGGGVSNRSPSSIFYASVLVASDYTFIQDAWTHIVIEYTGGYHTSTNVNFYINGDAYNGSFSTSGSSPGATALNLNANTPLTLGYNSSSEWYSGSISNFKLWNVALTAEEVAAEYALGRTGKSINLTDTALCLGGTVPRAHLDVRGSAMFDGRVGIGTTNPGALLELSGASQIDNSTPTKLRITSTTTGTTGTPIDTTKPYGLITFYTPDTSTAGKGDVAGIGGRFESTLGGDTALCFYTDGDNADDNEMSERMCINHDGNVGIGVTNPGGTLTLQQTSGSYASGTGLRFLKNGNRWDLGIVSNSDDNFAFAYNGSSRGYFRYNGSNTVQNFTGQHRTFIKNVPFSQAGDLEGLIVSSDQNKYIKMSGGIEAGSNAITTNESLPLVSLSTKVNDKKCFGVISASEDPETREDTYGSFVTPYEKELGDTRVYINSVGEGAMWVVNTAGALESGDYITTSNVAGYGQKQESDSLKNYTVAKITMDCDFVPTTQPIQIIKKELSNVNYWVKTTVSNVSLEEYSNLAEENRTTEDETYYTKDVEQKFTYKPTVTVTADDAWDDVSIFPSDVTYAEWSNLEANVQNTYTLTYTQNDYESMRYEKTTVSNVTAEDAWDAVHIEPPGVTYAEYSNLEANVQNTFTLTYMKSVTTTTSPSYYSNLAAEEQELYTAVYLKTVTEDADADTEGADAHIRTIYKKIEREETKEERDDEEWVLEVRQELVNVLDEHGQLQWEDTDQTEKAYKIRYLDVSGAITDEANAVHIAAFVGCTYHCG